MWLAALSMLALVIDVVLATVYTADGQQGNTISGTDMATGVPLAGVGAYVVFVLGVWAVWHLPGVQKRRALRHAVRARLAAQIGPGHPFRQFSVLHPYWAFFLKTMLIFEALQLVFGRVTPRRR